MKKIKHWELWPFYIIYAPLGFVWLYYAFKAKAFWFFSPVNPTLEFSGFEGENKKEMYEQLPATFFPKTTYVTAKQNFDSLINNVTSEGFFYPFIVKPQVGMQGMMFRKIENEQQFKQYHNQMPVDYLVQTFVDYAMECSVFHIRYPGQLKGKVTGFILKDYLAVTGDGKLTLLQLIQKHRKASHLEDEMRHKHAKNLNQVIPAGQKYYLSMAGNHNRGATFINLHEEIDEQLCDVFDKISLEAGHFYFGRYDIKCTSLKDLKNGENFTILEYNGTGSEPNHIYDCGMKYSNALRVIIGHWEDMYRIGKINNKQGVRYWNYLEGYRHLKKSKHFFKELNKADLACEL